MVYCYAQGNGIRTSECRKRKDMMSSSNGNICSVTGPSCGEYTGHRWIPRTKASNAVFDVPFDLRLNWTSSLVNDGDAGDLRRHRSHYDVIVMNVSFITWIAYTPPGWQSDWFVWENDFYLVGIPVMGVGTWTWNRHYMCLFVIGYLYILLFIYTFYRCMGGGCHISSGYQRH